MFIPESETTTLSVTEAAESRRSIRRFEQEPIPAEHLREMIRITSLAPSANNLQPWRFVVVESAELRGRLQEAAMGQAQVGSAPAVMVLYSDMRDVLETVEETLHPGFPEERKPVLAATARRNFGAMSEQDREQWGAGQAYIALGYLLLAARSLGYDSSPMLGFDAARVKELLGLPSHVAIPAIVAVGRGAEPGFPHHRHPVERIAAFR